jgi:hypothetical protein
MLAGILTFKAAFSVMDVTSYRIAPLALLRSTRLKAAVSFFGDLSLRPLSWSLEQ